MAAKAAELYDEDHYAWTRDQATALRRLAAERWNGPLDLEHLAEEIEDVGLAERNAVKSQLRRIIEHLLKLEHSQAVDPRPGWIRSIDDARAEIEARLTRSMRPEIVSGLGRLYEHASRAARSALREHGESEQAAAIGNSGCPYGLDDLLREGWYPPNRCGIVDIID